jgi:hypothetical protein
MGDLGYYDSQTLLMVAAKSHQDRPWSGGQGMKHGNLSWKLGVIPSGYVKIAIENGHL